MDPIRLRRRTRVLSLACLALAGLALSGWLRSAPDEDVRPLVPQTDEDVERLRRQLTDANHTERIRMLHRLGRGGGARATEAIVELLRTASSDRVRMIAIAQLGQVGSREAVDELVAIVQAPGNRGLRLAAIDAIGQARSAHAVDSLSALLDEGDPAQRRAVIRALGEAGGARAAERLTRLCQDERERERAAAIRALGRTGSGEALSLLRTVLRAPGSHAEALSLKQAAVAALGDLGTAEAKQTLIRQLQGDDRELRPAAIKALAGYAGDDVQVLLAQAAGSDDGALAQAALEAIGDADSALSQQVLGQALRSDQQQTRVAAVRALGKADTPEAQQALISLLHDPQLASHAAAELASQHSPEARAALLGAASPGAGLQQQQAALSALSTIQGSDVEQALGQLARTAPPQVAAQALGHLALRQGPQAKELLLSAYTDGNRAVRAAAVSALAGIGGSDPAVKQALVQAARSGDWNVTYSAIAGLAKLPPEQSRPLLTDLLKNGPRTTVSGAAQALAHLGGDETRKVLLEALKDSDTASNVSWALSQMSDPETRRQLAALLDDPSASSQTKQHALSALQQTGDAGTLVAAAGHADAGIASSALRSLGRVGGAEAERTLINALSSTDDENRKQAALSALSELGTPGALAALKGALADDKSFGHAASALAQIGGKEALAALTDAYQSAGAPHRRQLVSQLYHNSGPHGRALLRLGLGDQDETVVATAAGALSQVGGVQDKQQLLSLMQSSASKRVRRAIASMLRNTDRRIYKTHKELIDRILNG